MSQTIPFLLSDAQVEETIGERVRHYRLDQNLSQAELAEKAGLARRTITSIEGGQGCTVNSLVRVLRALQKLDLLQRLLDPPPLSPMRVREEAIAREKGQRKRASKPRKPDTEEPWRWEDEK